MTTLAELHALPREDAVRLLLPVCHARRWAERVADGRPYADLADLQAAADTTWLALGPADWREALDGHPRLGEQGGASAEASRREQAGLAGAGDDVRAALAAGNREYEARFGHVFLVSAQGRSAAEVLASLRERLSHGPEEELAVAAQEHRRITALRLAALLGG